MRSLISWNAIFVQNHNGRIPNEATTRSITGNENRLLIQYVASGTLSMGRPFFKRNRDPGVRGVAGMVRVRMFGYGNQELL
jgi:hypothetical protein